MTTNSGNLSRYPRLVLLVHIRNLEGDGKPRSSQVRI